MANFKRILAGVMSGVTAVSLAACSNSATNGSGAGESDTTNTNNKRHTVLNRQEVFRRNETPRKQFATGEF